MCEPTPTSTLYSTSTSWLYTTVTTSYSSIITPSPQISTSWLTSCLLPLGQELLVPSGDSSASAITRGTSSGTGSSNHESTSTANAGSVGSTASGHAQNAARLAYVSFPGDSAFATATPESSASESATTTSNLLLHPRGALDEHQITARSFDHPGSSKGDGKSCGSYTTFTSYATSIAKESTSWITSVYTSSSSSLIAIPTSTLYATCEPTSTSRPSTSARVPSTSTPTSTVTSISASTSTSSAALSTLSSVATSSSATSPGDSELIVGHYNSTIASSITLSSAISRSSGVDLVVSQTPISKPSPQAQKSSAQAEQVSEPIDTVSSTTTSTSTSTSPVLPALPATASTDSKTAPNSIASSDTPPITLPVTQPLTAAQLATSSGVASRVRIPSTTLATTGSDHQSDKGTTKGKTAGAVIGGLIGICLLIGLVLFGVRTYLKRKRRHRTHELRSSWFYGGDVLGPQDSDDDNGGGGEKTYTSQLGQARFSSPSHTSRASSRFSRGLPAFLGHVRHASGRFPAFARKSFYGEPTLPSGPSISWPANSPDAPVPLPVRSISTPIPLEHEAHDQVSPNMNHIDFAGSPQSHVHVAPQVWGQSYARQDIESQSQTQTQAPMILFTAPTESAYSSSSADLIENDEPSPGQATTTLGRASPLDLPLFPLPPNTTPLSFPEPSISGTRPFTQHEPTSSLFEYADYDHEYPYAESTQPPRLNRDNGHEGSETNTWNDNRRWDGTSMAFTTSIYSQPSEAGAGQSVYGGLNANDANPNTSRRSKGKSVRWGDDGSGYPHVSGLARAL